MTLWSNNAVSTDVALTAKIPVFTYGEWSHEHILMIQPLAMMMPLNLEVEDGEVVEVNAANNNSHDPKPFSVSESTISAHPATNQDNTMDIEVVLEYEPSEEEEEEVT